MTINQSGKRLLGFLLLDARDLLGPLKWSVLDTDANSHRAKAENERCKVHTESQRSGHEQEADGWITDHDVLHVKLDEQDDQEPPVVVD